MPIDDGKLFGTEGDGSASTDYCVYCYRDGRFTMPDMTANEMIEMTGRWARSAGMTEEQAVGLGPMMMALKRWAA